MGVPKITRNEDYDDDGGHVIKITSDFDPKDYRQIIVDKSKLAYVMELNRYDKNGNGQPIRHTDNRTGAVHLTYYGKRVSDAIMVSVSGPRIYLQLFLENGDRESYVCNSKDELEWFRKGLGFSSLDRSPFKV